MSTTEAYVAPTATEMRQRANDSLDRKGTRQTELNLAGDVLALAALADKLLDAVIWMSGSRDFAPEGEAHEGWIKVREGTVKPALKMLASR